MEYNNETLPYLETLIPFMNQYGICDGQDPREIGVDEIKAIAIRWGIKHPLLTAWGAGGGGGGGGVGVGGGGGGGEVIRKRENSSNGDLDVLQSASHKKKEDKGGDLKTLLMLMCNTALFLQRNKRTKLQRRLLDSETEEAEGNNSADENKDDAYIQNRNSRMQIKNYFGLPPYAVQSNDKALVYLCRKPILVKKKLIEEDLQSESSLEEYDGEGRRITTRVSSPNGHMSSSGILSEKDVINSNSKVLEDSKDEGEGYMGVGADSSKKNPLAALEATKGVDQSAVAQKAVVKALYTMANNTGMRHHYIYKGGIDAVNRLINESDDEFVLNVCAKCIDTVASSDRNVCKALVQEKSLLLVLGTLCDKCDPKTTKIIVSRILWHCSCVRGLENILLQNNIMTLLQILVAPEETIEEIIAMVLITAINISVGILGNDVENVVKFVMSLVNRLNGSTRCFSMFYILENLANMTRLQQFSSMLVDRSILALLIHYIDSADYQHQTDQLLTYCIESFVNLSLLRKNRREISTCGISNYLDRFFVSNNSFARSQALLMVGNLLNSGFFHDRISREPIVRDLLYRLLDHSEEKQYLSVTFVVSQLSNSNHSVPILMQCNVIRRVLEMFEYTMDVQYTNVPGAIDATAAAASGLTTPQEREKKASEIANTKCLVDGNFLLWAMLMNLSARRECLRPVFLEANSLIFEYQRLVEKNQVFDSVVIVFYNLSLHLEFKEYISSDCVENLVYALKSGLTVSQSNDSIKNRTSNYLYLCAITLANIAKNIPSARVLILGDDLLNLVEQIGFEDYKLNIYWLSIYNSISNEENCCIRMIEMGALKQLVSIHATLYAQVRDTNTASKGKREETKSTEEVKIAVPNKNTPISDMNTGPGTLIYNTMVTWAPEPVDNGVKLDKEVAMALIAATFHNLSLKRATLVTGMLTVLLDLIKNDKSTRVLNTCRALMSMSCHAKSKTVLGKNSQILTQLTALMRFGVEKTEQVQDYCAVSIANILATNSVEKKIIDEIITERPSREGRGEVNPNFGCVSDLLVIALLRINSIETKVILAKAMFNLVCRTDIRMVLLTKLEMLSAFIEICRNESIELLEMTARVVYNVSCDLVTNSGNLGGESTFSNAKNVSPEHIHAVANLFNQLKIVNWVLNRMTQSNVLATSSSSSSSSSSSASAGGSGSNGNGTSSGSGGSESSKSAVTSKPTRAIKIMFAMTLANASYSKPLLAALANEKKTAEAVRIFSTVDSDEITFCLSIIILNVSRMPGSIILADTVLIQVVNEVLVKTKNATIIQTLVAALCNFSNYRQFHDVLCTMTLDTMIKILSNATVSNAIKLDVITYLFNLTTQHSSTRMSAAGQFHAIAGIWRFLKSQDDHTVMMKIARITRELCQMAIGSVEIYQTLLADGVMNILLRLAKLELVLVKLDVSCSIYCLSSIENLVESQKFVKYDAVDILYWILLHDCLSANTTIFKYISLALRNLSLYKENCVLFVKEDRILNILKNLSKTSSDDILINIAVTLLNMLHVEFCRIILLGKGVFALLYEIADVQNMTVRQTCSSCLHLIQESIPDPDDPQVLPLLLCLLDQNDGISADALERFNDYIIPYKEGSISIKPLELPMVEQSPFFIESTNFTPTWITLICDADNFFSPVHLHVNYGKPISCEVRPLQSSASSSLKDFKKLDTIETLDLIEWKDDVFDGGENESINTPQSSLKMIESSNNSQTTEKNTKANTNSNNVAVVDTASFSVPELVAPPPSSIKSSGKEKKPTKYDLVMNKSQTSSNNNSSSNSNFKEVSFVEGNSTDFQPNNSMSSVKSISSKSDKLPKLSSKKVIPDDTLSAINKTIMKQGATKQTNIVSINSQSVKSL